MRNILLLIENLADAGALAKKALIVARQCKANLQLCHVVKNKVSSKLVVHLDDDELYFDENSGLDIEEFAQQLINAKESAEVFVPAVSCLEISTFNPREISEMVVRHGIWLLIMDERQLNNPEDIVSENKALKIINSINCPVLLMPRDFDLDIFNKIAYVTDLRYCDLGVVRFLKAFNSPVFVTHVTAPGLPGLDERYAQEILSEEICTKSNYSKLFLRNIKSEAVNTSLEYILDTIGIKMLALVNKKHKTFERLFGNSPEGALSYHNLPTLIFPYLNWFNQASFYA